MQLHHPDVQVRCIPSSVAEGIPLEWTGVHSDSGLSTAVLFAGGEPTTLGWRGGRLLTQWHCFALGTFVVTNDVSSEEGHTWFVSASAEVLWEHAALFDFRQAFGHELPAERRWPDWARLSLLGPVRTFDPHERGECTWRDLFSFIAAYDFREYPRVVAELLSRAFTLQAVRP
jgi:hypothetical protein